MIGGDDGKPPTEVESRYRALVESAPDGILVHRGGAILYANPAAARIFGAPDPARLVGVRVLDLVRPDERGLVQERIRRIEEEGARTDPIELHGLRLDGTPVDIEAAGHRVLYDGRVADQSVVRDVSRRKQAEREAAVGRLARPVVREIVQALLAHVPVPRAATGDLGRRLAGARFASLDDALGAFRAMGLGDLALVGGSGARFEFAGRDLIESRPGQAQPTCHLSLSFLEGALSSLHGRAALGSEMRCQSMRHDECRFIVMLKDG